jgi:hypothetical protein
VTFVDPQTLTLAWPEDLPADSYDLALETPAGFQLALAQAVVVADARLVIEDAPGGAGIEVSDRTLAVDASLPLHAVSRFADDNSFIADEIAGWSVDGDAGTLDGKQDSMVTFHAAGPGSAVVTATHTAFASDSTGALQVAASCADCSAGICIKPCTAADCELTCDSPCACELSCAAGAKTCGANCAGQEDCRVNCAGATSCASTCSGNATCDVRNCAGAGSCAATCSGNASCRFDCANASDCGPFRCQGGARCLLSCAGATNCGFESCGGAETSCAGGIIACNRACP